MQILIFKIEFGICLKMSVLTPNHIVSIASRISKIFPKIDETDVSYTEMIKKYYKINEVLFRGNYIIKSNFNGVEIYTNIDQNGYNSVPCDSALIKILPNDMDKKIWNFIKSLSIPEAVEQYIVTGKVDYNDVLRSIYEKTINKEKELKEAEIRQVEIDKIMEEFIKNGKVKVPFEYLKDFEKYKHHTDGFHYLCDN